METILSSEFKRQMVLLLDGGPHIIEDLHTSGTAQKANLIRAYPSGNLSLPYPLGKARSQMFSASAAIAGWVRPFQRR